MQNVYEDILQQILQEDVSKGTFQTHFILLPNSYLYLIGLYLFTVLKEAATLKRYNLFMEPRHRLSTSSSYSTPPGSPDYTSTLKKAHNALPASPLLRQPLIQSQHTGEDPELDEKMALQEVIMVQHEEVQTHVQPALIKVYPSEDKTMAEKLVEQEVFIQPHAQQESSIAEKVEAKQDEIVVQQVEVQFHALDLSKVCTSVKADEKHKVEDNKIVDVPCNTATEIQNKPTTPEEKTYSGHTETLVDPSSSSQTEPALEPAAQILAEPIPKPLETPVQACPPDGDTRSVDHVSRSETSSSLKFVSAESETESSAKVRISSPEVPNSSGVKPFTVEEQTSNATEDTKDVVDDLTSKGSPIYEIRVSNKIQDFSDNTSWTTEEEGESMEEDALTTETTAANAKPEDSVILKCESISDVNANVTNNPADHSSEAGRPLDCVKEIRDLVVEVIEVEEVVQHYPEHGGSS